MGYEQARGHWIDHKRKQHRFAFDSLGGYAVVDFAKHGGRFPKRLWIKMEAFLAVMYRACVFRIALDLKKSALAAASSSPFLLTVFLTKQQIRTLRRFRFDHAKESELFKMQNKVVNRLVNSQAGLLRLLV